MVSENLTKKFLKLKIDDYYYEVPIYLIKGLIPNEIDNELIRKSLIFTRNFFKKIFFHQII